jgi:NAD(P)-dependent dehydrogenase (short-subunit alcohol dehydrogenase family)
VIAVSSTGAYNRVPSAGFASSTSKAGTTHMMKQLATVFVPFDIRSNVIAPGSTSPTPLPGNYDFRAIGG